MGDRVWHGALYTLPFLCIGTGRSILFPEQGRIFPSPFRITRTATRWGVRPSPRSALFPPGRPVASMPTRFTADTGGASRAHHGLPRHPLAFRFRAFFSGTADVCEWYDDHEQCFRIKVSAENRLWGKLFGYKGKFQLEWRPTKPGDVPPDILPQRTECHS
jgi:hypothetical protein